MRRPLRLTALGLAVGALGASAVNGFSADARPAAPTSVQLRAAAAAPGSSSAAVHTIATTASASTPIRFSRMVATDFQRAGDEPDVKVDGQGHIYSSAPFGFSNTQSFLWSSLDHGNSYHLVPGNVGGKPETCVGGGDTDLYIDPGNALYFSDLQGLTNISMSRSTDGGSSFSTSCTGAPNSPVDRMWYAATGSLAKSNLHMYQDYDQVEGGDGADTNDIGSNQLVETFSSDGLTFGPVTNAAAATACPGAGIQDCITNNEGISGNQVADPATGNIYIAHTTTNGTGSTPGVQVSEGKVTIASENPPIASAVWHESRNLDAALCPHTNGTCAKSGSPTELAGENFASIAEDSRGFLYVTFTAGPVDGSGNLTRAEQIYVVHSLQRASTTTNPKNMTWSRPIRITGANRGISRGTNTFPWVTAGTNGRMAVAYYHSAELSEGTGANKVYGASSLANAHWTVQVAQTLNGHARTPSWRRATVSDGYIKKGQICTAGVGCVTGGDRSLGDFLQIAPDRNGAMLVSYVDDVSGNFQGGESAGNVVVSRQISGPGLVAGTTVRKGAGPGSYSNKVSDGVGDAFYSSGGTRTYADKNAAPQLDITGASVSQPKGRRYLVARIHVRSLKALTGSTALGGPDASWIMRWTEFRPKRDGGGITFYVGLDNNAAGSGTPTAFRGRTACIPPGSTGRNCKYFTYPQRRKVGYKLLRATNTILLHIPRKNARIVKGTKLVSMTAFSATSATPQSATTLFNVIDAAAPFDVTAAH